VTRSQVPRQEAARCPPAPSSGRPGRRRAARQRQRRLVPARRPRSAGQPARRALQRGGDPPHRRGQPPPAVPPAVIVHLVDGTYELFRYFLSPAAAFDRSAPEELRAVRGVVGSILGMLEGGATHIGVATDHVIESFRNALWPQYKTG